MTQHDHTPQDPDPTAESDLVSDQPGPGPDTDHQGTSPDTDQQGSAAATDTTVYVRKRRSPTLAFWVMLAIVVPAIAGLLVAPFLGLTSAGGLLTFAFIAVLSIGVPLAALAALVDLILDRRRRRRSAR